MPVAGMKASSKHGHSGYRRGCRCEVCRTARAEYMRDYLSRPEQAQKHRKRTAEYRKTQKGRKYHAARERLRREQLQHTDSMDYAMVLLEDPCSYCGGPADSLDHIEPVASGGSGEWENLTASCRKCNSSKNARSLLVFLALKG